MGESILGDNRPADGTPAGWYADPWLDGGSRYWNGEFWTADHRAAPGATPDPAPDPEPPSRATLVGKRWAPVIGGLSLLLVLGAIGAAVGGSRKPDGDATASPAPTSTEFASTTSTTEATNPDPAPTTSTTVAPVTSVPATTAPSTTTVAPAATTTTTAPPDTTTTTPHGGWPKGSTTTTTSPPKTTTTTGPPATTTTTTMFCDPNYSDCVPIALDVDCYGRGNGPVFVDGPVRVLRYDVYGLDSDHDGIACG